MVNSPNMLIPHIAANQNQKEVTHGDGVDLIDKWLTEDQTISVSAGNYTLSSTEAREHLHFRVTGATVAGRQLIFPAGTGFKMERFVTNDAANTQAILIVKGTTQISLGVNQAAIIKLDGTANGIYAVIGGSITGTTIASLVPTEPFFGARIRRGADSASLTSPISDLALTEIGATNNGNGLDTVDFDTGFPETSTRRPSFALTRKIFDGSNAAVVIVGTDQIVITAHGWVTGMGPFTYRNGGGTNITGLTDGTLYWIIRVDNDNIKVALSRANALAGTAVDLTAVGTGTTHRLDGCGRIMIPDGVNRVKLVGAFSLTTGTGGISVGPVFRLRKGVAGSGVAAVDPNGGGFYAYFANPTASQNSTTGGMLESGELSVVGGDWFELSLTMTWATTVRSILADTAKTWFGLRVIEYNGAPAEQIEFDFLGTPANGATVFQKVIARKTVMNDEFNNSRAYMKTAPVGTIVFDVQRNAVSIGSITFTSANVGTFTTTAGTIETFVEGDRLEVIAPSDLKGAADLMVNFWAWRSS